MLKRFLEWSVRVKLNPSHYVLWPGAEYWLGGTSIRNDEPKEDVLTNCEGFSEGVPAPKQMHSPCVEWYVHQQGQGA
eukprot:4208052-Amphidinium_carterae.1